MKLAHSFPPTLRVDALGIIATIALTAGAAALAIGPRLLFPAPSHTQQQADLNARLNRSLDSDRQADLAQRTLADLKSQEITAVTLKPASTMNQRLGDIATLAEPLGISITKLIPGPALAAPPAPAAAPSAGAPATPPPLTTIVSIKLAGTGTYPAISGFLHALHDEFRDTALSSLKLSTNLEPHQSENLSATFSIDLAWYAAPDASDGAPPKQ